MRAKQVLMYSCSAAILLLAGITFLNPFDWMDRLGLVSNKVSVESKCNCRFPVFAKWSGDDARAFDLVQSQEFETGDWYGKDRIDLEVPGHTYRVSFGEYKFNSYEKVKCIIETTDHGPDSVRVAWTLESHSIRNSGCFIFPCE